MSIGRKYPPAHRRRSSRLLLRVSLIMGVVFVLLVTVVSLRSSPTPQDPPQQITLVHPPPTELSHVSLREGREEILDEATPVPLAAVEPATTGSSGSSSSSGPTSPPISSPRPNYIKLSNAPPTQRVTATTLAEGTTVSSRVPTTEQLVTAAPETPAPSPVHKEGKQADPGSSFPNKNSTSLVNASGGERLGDGSSNSTVGPPPSTLRTFPFRSRRSVGTPKRHAAMTNTVGMLEMEAPEDLSPETPTTLRCGPHSARTEAGLYSGTPIDSVVSIALDADSRETAVHELSRIYLAGASNSEYFTFLADHNASMSALDSSSSSSSPCEESVPFAMDVVYTYVNDSAPSHRNARNESGQQLAADTMRYRDWNELLYSMRTVYHRALVDGLVRKVHIVVAERDQVPAWLNASDPRINIVLHSQIFPADEPDALPTFNSHAIESVLHRIPGLSRFFVYFNNDMLWGRRVSFFDYFRPISAERQQHREERLRRMGCGGVVPADTDTRITVMFEPILYFENIEGIGECGVKNNFSVAQAVDEHSAHAKSRANSSHDNMTATSHIPCEAVPLRAASIYTFMCRQRVEVAKGPGRPFVVSKAELWRRFVNYNKAVLFCRIDGFWPTHSFAHIPRLMDRQLQLKMEEGDFADLAKATRATRNRETRVFWTTYAFAYYALSHRRALDAEVEVEMGRWSRRDVNTSDADVLPLLGPLMDYKNGELPPEHQFNIDLAAVALQVATQPPPGVADNSSVVKAILGSPAFASATETLNYALVKLDRKPGMYYFCMMRSAVALRKCLNELVDRMQLFVTVNDDMPRIPLYPRPGFNIIDLMKKFLETVSGQAPAAPWELPNVTIAFHRPVENVNGVVPNRRTFDEAFAAAHNSRPRNASSQSNGTSTTTAVSSHDHVVSNDRNASADRRSGSRNASTSPGPAPNEGASVAPKQTTFELMFLAVN